MSDSYQKMNTRFRSSLGNVANAHLALIERAKIVEYLLNPAHPDNGGKAPFFMALGFKTEDGESLTAALRRLGLTSTVSQSMETVHGKKYINGRYDGNAFRQVARRAYCLDYG